MRVVLRTMNPHLRIEMWGTGQSLGAGTAAVNRATARVVMPARDRV